MTGLSAGRKQHGGVVDLGASDLAATALLHLESLPDGFFAELGPRFLREYHRAFVSSPYAVALAAKKHDTVDGFLLAVLEPAAHGRHVVRHSGARLAAFGVLALLARPRVLALFLRTRLARYARGVWRRAGRSPAPRGTPDSGWTVLSHVAVSPGSRGSGAGASLVRELHRRALAWPSAGVVLLTDPDGPGPRFYAKLGYDSDGAVVGADGRRWLRFRHPLVR